METSDAPVHRLAPPRAAREAANLKQDNPISELARVLNKF